MFTVKNSVQINPAHQNQKFLRVIPRIVFLLRSNISKYPKSNKRASRKIIENTNTASLWVSQMLFEVSFLDIQEIKRPISASKKTSRRSANLNIFSGVKSFSSWIRRVLESGTDSSVNSLFWAFLRKLNLNTISRFHSPSSLSHQNNPSHINRTHAEYLLGLSLAAIENEPAIFEFVGDSFDLLAWLIGVILDLVGINFHEISFRLEVNGIRDESHRDRCIDVGVELPRSPIFEADFDALVGKGGLANY